MILVKLGGSVITDKSKALAPRRGAAGAIARALRRAGEPAVIVHGGGSFGHYWSVRYGMHTAPGRYDVRGVARVKDSMVRLNGMVLGELLQAGLNPYCMPPGALVPNGRPSPAMAKEVTAVAKSGMTPVTYGDALWAGRGKTYILSGDRIMTHLARLQRPRLCIFALAEDGLYRDMGSRELVREWDGGRADVSEGADATGGMARKLREARAISRGGTPVLLVNGNMPRRISDAIAGRRFEGTLFRRGR